MLRKFFPDIKVNEEDSFNKFTEQQEVTVIKVDSLDNGTVLYYEWSGSLTSREYSKYIWIREKAEMVLKDSKFSNLSNMRQREFYLLENYTLNSVDAKDVCEYINMRKKVNECT
jgi:hypothetical protein